MSIIKNDRFQDRRAAADTARKALIARFKNRPASDSPEMLEKKAERARIKQAREMRKSEREQAKRAEAERAERDRIAQAMAAEAAAAAVRLAKEESEQALANQVLQYEAERKSKRDARYAARKARQG